MFWNKFELSQHVRRQLMIIKSTNLVIALGLNAFPKQDRDSLIIFISGVTFSVAHYEIKTIISDLNQRALI